MGNASEPAHLESCLWDTSTLANSLHELEDCVHHLCVVISVHLALPMTCLHLWLCGGINFTGSDLTQGQLSN